MADKVKLGIELVKMGEPIGSKPKPKPKPKQKKDDDA